MAHKMAHNGNIKVKLKVLLYADDVLVAETEHIKIWEAVLKYITGNEDKHLLEKVE